MNNSTDWAPAIAILAAGLVLGLLFIYFVRRRRSAGSSPLAERSERQAELEARRDILLQQLREVADDADAADQRAALELEAAEVLRELDQFPETAPATLRSPFFTRHPVLKGYMLGVASVAGVGLLGYYGSTFATPRETAGGAMNTASSPAPQMPSDPQLQQLEQAVSSDPENVESRIALARAYFGRDNMMGVFEHTNAVLAKDANEPRALTYNAIVLMTMGRLEEAIRNLERATKRDPMLLDAWVALASVRTQAGDHDAAAAAIQSAIAKHPKEETRLKAVLAEMRAQLQQPSAAPAPSSAAVAELPPGHPPMPGASLNPTPEAAPHPTSVMAPTAPAAAPIRITLTIDESAKLKSGVVYLIAREDGPGKGHPLAVKRVTADSFPLSVDLGGADSMMGQPLPARVRVEARLDSDGDAGTTDATDPKAAAGGVSAGAVLALTLK